MIFRSRSPLLALAALVGATAGAADRPAPAPGAVLELSTGSGQNYFVADTARAHAALAADGPTLRLGPNTVRLRFPGADSSAAGRLLGTSPRTTSWIRSGGVATARHGHTALFEDAYRGVDLAYSVRTGELEFDWIVRPGADPGQIRIAAADPAQIAADGGLRLGDLELRPPQTYQDAPTGRHPVPSRYELDEAGQVRIALGDYDPDLTLVIDPRIGLATYLGGAALDQALAVKLADDGSLWVAGVTNSFDFPLPEDAFPSQPEGGTDAYVTQLRRTGSGQQTVWEIAATIFIGGSSADRATAVDIDAQGRVYVFGETRSSDFPVTADADQRAHGGGADAFLTILVETDFPFFQLRQEDRAQRGLTNYEVTYSTFLGGASDESVSQGFLSAFAPAPAPRCAALAGLTDSTSFPATIFSIQDNKSGGADGFFAVYCSPNPGDAPRQRTYATFLGGQREETSARAAVSADGSFCMAVQTSSLGLPSNGPQAAPAGATDLYVTCRRPTRRRFGLPFLYESLGATYYGGSENENLAGLAISAVGPQRVWALLDTTSTNIPAVTEAPPLPAGATASNPGFRSLLTVAFPLDASRPAAQFWLGGAAEDRAASLDVRDDCLAIAGRTRSAAFPVSETFPSSTTAGAADILTAKFCFDADLRLQRQYSGFLGSRIQDVSAAISAGPNGNEAIVGFVDANGSATLLPEGVSQASPGLPVTSGAPQAEFAGGAADGFVLELFRPRLRREAVAGAADFQVRPIAPGQILTLFGVSVGPRQPLTAQLDAQNRLPTRLGPTRVLLDGRPAPLLFAAENQVSLIAPFTLEGRSETKLEVEVDGARSLPVTAPVAPTTPAIFTLGQTGQGQAAVLNQDFSVNGPQNPAARGSAIQIFLTGGGQTQPPGVDGELTPIRQPFPALRASATARVGGLPAQILYAGGAPGLVQGVTQINLVVPREATPDAATPLEINIGGASTQSGVTVAIR